MTTPAVVVFTRKSVDHMLDVGGSASWRLNRAHAMRCTYVVCCRNGEDEQVEGIEPHRSAFMVGRIEDVVPDAPGGSRWLIRISEYALIDLPDVWEGRNPVRYMDMEELGIEPDELDFQPVPAVSSGAVNTTPCASEPETLTIPEAKRRLGQAFGVSPEAVEITIRG